MAKKAKRSSGQKVRNLFEELMSGVKAMREHREGRVTLRSRRVEPGSSRIIQIRSSGSNL